MPGVGTMKPVEPGTGAAACAVGALSPGWAEAVADDALGGASPTGLGSAWLGFWAETSVDPRLMSDCAQALAGTIAAAAKASAQPIRFIITPVRNLRTGDAGMRRQFAASIGPASRSLKRKFQPRLGRC